MLTRADLDEAVKSGIITEGQAAALQELPAKRHAARHSHALGDERFVFMKNFNEFFITLGIVLLSIGLFCGRQHLLRPRRGISGHLHRADVGAGRISDSASTSLTLPSIVLALLIVPGIAWYLPCRDECRQRRDGMAWDSTGSAHSGACGEPRGTAFLSAFPAALHAAAARRQPGGRLHRRLCPVFRLFFRACRLRAGPVHPASPRWRRRNGTTCRTASA